MGAARCGGGSRQGGLGGPAGGAAGRRQPRGSGRVDGPAAGLAACGRTTRVERSRNKGSDRYPAAPGRLGSRQPTAALQPGRPAREAPQPGDRRMAHPQRPGRLRAVRRADAPGGGGSEARQPRCRRRAAPGPALLPRSGGRRGAGAAARGLGGGGGVPPALRLRHQRPPLPAPAADPQWHLVPRSAPQHQPAGSPGGLVFAGRAAPAGPAGHPQRRAEAAPRGVQLRVSLAALSTPGDRSGGGGDRGAAAGDPAGLRHRHRQDQDRRGPDLPGTQDRPLPAGAVPGGSGGARHPGRRCLQGDEGGEHPACCSPG